MQHLDVDFSFYLVYLQRECFFLGQRQGEAFGFPLAVFAYRMAFLFLFGYERHDPHSSVEGMELGDNAVFFIPDGSCNRLSLPLFVQGFECNPAKRPFRQVSTFRKKIDGIVGMWIGKRAGSVGFGFRVDGMVLHISNKHLFPEEVFLPVVLHVARIGAKGVFPLRQIVGQWHIPENAPFPVGFQTDLHDGFHKRVLQCNVYVLAYRGRCVRNAVYHMCPHPHFSPAT